MATESQVYEVYAAGTMLGLEKTEVQNLVERGEFPCERFPFQVMRIGRSLVTPRKPIDDFLEFGRKPRLKDKRGRKKRWIDGEFLWYRFPVPNELDEQFDLIIKNVNKELPSKMDKADFQRLAIIEFIQRRPEFLNVGDKNGR